MGKFALLARFRHDPVHTLPVDLNLHPRTRVGVSPFRSRALLPHEQTTSPLEICAADPIALTPEMAAEMTGGTTSGTWIRLIPSGSFMARDGRGPFDAGDETGLQAIIARRKPPLLTAAEYP